MAISGTVMANETLPIEELSKRVLIVHEAFRKIYHTPISSNADGYDDPHVQKMFLAKELNVHLNVCVKEATLEQCRDHMNLYKSQLEMLKENRLASEDFINKYSKFIADSVHLALYRQH